MNSQIEEWLDACKILGFDTLNLFQDNCGNPSCTQCILSSNDTVWLDCKYKLNGSENISYDINCRVNGVDMGTVETDSISKMIRAIDKIHNEYNYEILASCILAPQGEIKSAITAGSSTRDLLKNLVRVKSSNVWSVGINIRDRKDKFGDVLAQFKNNTGGPGDVYIYYDVPIRIYRRWQSASSKGHYFWQYIRNYYKYSKLTGDKRGKLPNAIN